MTLSDKARALLPAPARDRPLLGRLAGRGSTVTVESLLALQPHLVLDAGSKRCRVPCPWGMGE